MNKSTIENELIAIWRGIFPSEEIKPDSDFFDLGGNSLTAITLLSRVEERFGQEVLLPDTLFSNGCLRELACVIAENLDQNQSPTLPST